MTQETFSKKWVLSIAQKRLHKAFEKDLETLLAAERKRWAKQVDEEAQRDIDRGNPIEGAHYRALRKVGGLT